MKNIVHLMGLLVVTLSFPAKVFAFKINTHVWVGAQVIEDVSDDNKVSIPPFGEFSVDGDIVTALKSNPKAYLYGNVGPDFFPDMLAGQTVIHPGREQAEYGGEHKKGWNTDQWFAHILRKRKAMTPSELSFAMGYLSHGATDFWAHSYVNTYAGGIFNIADADKFETEIRHFLLENYIGKMTPDVILNSGINCGQGLDALNCYQGEFPAEFIRDEMIYSPRVRGKYIYTAPHLTIASYLKDGLPLVIDFVDGFRNRHQKVLGDFIQGSRDEHADVLAGIRDAKEGACNLGSESVSIHADAAEAAAVLDDELAKINQSVAEAAEKANSQLLGADDAMLSYISKYQKMGFEAINDIGAEVLALQTKLFSDKQALETKMLGWDSQVRAESCEVFNEAIDLAKNAADLPIDMHNLSIDLLPISDSLKDDLKLRGGLLDDVHDTALEIATFGLFSSGGGSEPEPVSFSTISGDRDYFLAMVSVLDEQIAELAPHLEDAAGYQDSNPGQFFSLLQALDSIETRRALALRVLQGLKDNHAVTIVVSNYGHLGMSNHSKENPAFWLCEKANGVLDASLQRSLYAIHSLEDRVHDSQKKLYDKLSDINRNLVDAAEEVGQLAQHFDRAISDAFVHSMSLAYELNETASKGLDFSAEQLRDFANSVEKITGEACAADERLNEFVDEGNVEGAPYVAAFMYAYYTNDWEGLYTEWFYDFLKDWQRGVDQAMSTYVHTGRLIVDDLLDEKDVEDVLRRVEDWLRCEGIKMFGVSPFTAHNICLAGATIESASAEIRRWQQDVDRVVEKYAMPGIPEDLKLTKTNIDNLISDAIEKYSKKALIEIDEYEVLKEMFDKNKDLNARFSWTESDNNYLVFDKFSDPFSVRVDREMFVKDNKFSAESFAPAYNAVILAKLTLLNASELNRMVEMAGGHSGKYGSELFNDSDYRAYLNSPKDLGEDRNFGDKLLELTADSFEFYAKKPGANSGYMSYISSALNFASDYYESGREPEEDKVIPEPFNILIGAVRTIDGDHQWLEEPPRYIRQDGSDPKLPGNMSYRFDDPNGRKGFRLYIDEDARRNVFNKIFKGALNSSIETPDKHGLSPVIPDSYPYRVCEGRPYPNGEQDQFCSYAWLIPIINHILF